MANFMSGLLLAMGVGVIVYLYLVEKWKREISGKRKVLDELKQKIDKDPTYEENIVQYNKFIDDNAFILRKYGINPEPITRKPQT